MFQKPTFGANTSSFGMQSTFGSPASTSSSPFGTFKPTAGTSAFGAPPAFGATAATQPATGGGLFGSSNTSGGLFGATTTAPAPAFGANTSFGFGANTTGGGLFGANNTSSGLFGATQNNTGFAKPAVCSSIGFGSTTTNINTGGGLFGNTSTTGSGLFGQQTTSFGGGTGLFGSNTTGGFGQQQQATGTAHAKYNPVAGTDVIMKSGTSQNINIKHHCITCMKEYEGKSLEELRLEDYTAGRKGSTSGVFGFQQQESKPLFGATPGFGQAATTTASSVFGGGGLSTGGFGQTNTFSFGGNTQTSTNTSGLFGGNKPGFGATPSTGTGIFGAAATTQAPTFGTNTSTFGFGSNLQNNTSGGFFGQKPATSVFGAAPASTGFGSTGFGTTPSLFNTKPLQTQAPTFGAATGVGTMAGGFGANTSTTGFLGGNTTFGKPATTQPTFGFGSTQPTLGLGTGLGTNMFQNKPATGGINAFNPVQNFQQSGTLGGGGSIFGNTSTLGGSGLGLGLNTNNALLNNANLSGASAAGNVHEQILTMAARPYGDSPLFKDLLPDSSKSADDVLKPTNPAAMSAVLERAAYRVSPAASARLQLRTDVRHIADKKSLFDGLEESDASLEDKLSLKPSRKRLVLRPNQRNDSHNDSHDNTIARSHEEQARTSLNGDEQTDKENSQRDEVDRAKRNIDFPNGNNLDGSNDREGSWLSGSKVSWNEKEKPIDNEPTPRLYPNLDKEVSLDSERRASWLTTKPLRKPLMTAGEQENSVQELGVRTSHAYNLSQDKENVDTLSVSEDEHVQPKDGPPHPTGVKLTRPGYYTIPSLDEMISYMRSDGSCVVPHLTIGRTNYGNVYYDCEVDVAGLNLDALVHFLNKEVIVYPEDADKPPVGEGLNRRAIVTLDRIWPRDKSDKTLITDPDRLLKMNYEGKLRRACEKHDTKFIEYRPQTGSWVFRVEHFSKYGLTDSDEEDDITPDVLKRQLVNQSLQKNAAPAAIPPVMPAVGLGGLGGLGLGGLNSLSGPPVSTSNLSFDASRPLLALSQANIPGFEMDTTEDNSEAPSLYQESKAYGVKSPTAELARLENRQSHHVQLMKASLYSETALDDDMSVSSGDQLVPLVVPLVQKERTVLPKPVEISTEDIQQQLLEETQLKPLIIRPHTVVLKYHRQIPPFKHTIAGRLDAACIADMSISKARHFRVGFDCRSLVFPSTYNRMEQLDKDAELSELSHYMSGRAENDWSEQIIVRLGISQPNKQFNIPEILSKNLNTLLKYSSIIKKDEDSCPKLEMVQSPRARREALNEIIRTAATVRDCTAKFGVSGGYCYQVWTLCDALWGADLDNDGVVGTDDLSIVNRYRKFLEWITSAVSDVTDKELSKPMPAEKEDESDQHSSRIWTLLVGGRVLEACRVARDNGHTNMAAIIAQAAGDPHLRSLISRQMSVWRECGASSLISQHKMSTLELVSGTATVEHLHNLDWLVALHTTARYLCTQIPSLEQIVRKYSSLFPSCGEEGELSAPHDEMGMNLPLPPYMMDKYDVYCKEGVRKRVLDLRYELIRARAFNSRPKLSPEHYTEDPFDYSLSVILGAWFGTPATTPVEAASQLEAAGLWHMAIHALMYLQDDHVREHLVRGVLARHAPAQLGTAEVKARVEHVTRLGVPHNWIYLAQAHRAKYQHLPMLEAEYLVGAEQWNAAHKVLLDELLPNAVLCDNLQSIAPLLEKMNEAAKRHEIYGWENGGQALYNYLTVCDEIRNIVKCSSAEVPGRLEALRPLIAAACTATRNMPTDTPAHICGRAELGLRALGLARLARPSPGSLAAALHALRLPPDTAQHHIQQITLDLAEQASELCIESVNSSPISSHHRATATS